MDDIEKFNSLYKLYNLQKDRMIKLLEYDCKQIGVEKYSESIGVDRSYIYTIFRKKEVSHEKLLELYKHAQYLKLMLGVG